MSSFPVDFQGFVYQPLFFQNFANNYFSINIRMLDLFHSNAMDRLKDKVVVITGGSLGLGKATSIMAAHEGAKVIITDILDNERGKVKEEIRFQRGYIVTCD